MQMQHSEDKKQNKNTTQKSKQIGNTDSTTNNMWCWKES